MRQILFARKPGIADTAEDDALFKDANETKQKQESGNENISIDYSKSELLAGKHSAKSWESLPTVDNSFSTVGSSTTVNTLKQFGLSNHPGKSAEDIIIDAFMDIDSDVEKRYIRNDSRAKSFMPQLMNLQYSEKHNLALTCIARRDFEQLLSVVEATPEILLYQCKKNGIDLQSQSDEKTHLRGCYGGTILHVLVSQKPLLKKKRLRSNVQLMKDRVKSAFSCSNKNSFQLHVMPSIPHLVLKRIIKLAPEALLMTDDFGRLPIHCAILSQSVHLEEVSSVYKTLDSNSSRDISIVVREINIVQILLKSNPSTATVGDLKGNLPLHYAVAIGKDYFERNDVIFQKSDKYRKPSAADTVKLLIETNPHSVTVHNAEGNLPIHHIVGLNGTEINLSSLKLMMTYHNLCEEVLKERNKYGDPPLFIAIKSRAGIDVIKLFASVDIGISGSSQLFAQRDGSNNNILHVALRLRPQVDPQVLRAIITLAPFTASHPDSRNKMPIRYATEQDLSHDIIRKMLSRDMPIQIGSEIRQSSERSNSGLARHVVGKIHHHSFWHIVIECEDKYLSMIKSFLSEEATHSQIVTLARQVGPDGISILINCVSDKCRLVFHSLLRFYGRYEILLSSQDIKVKSDEILDGVQTFLALDHGLSTELPKEDCFSKLHKTSSDLSISSEQSISTAVRVRNEKKNETEVEVSLISKEKSKVVLRCYEYEEAYFAEVKVREKYDFPRQYYEELYNHHRDEIYTYLTLSKREKLCCITFERPDHTLAEVFASVSSGGQRSQKWIEKCWIVLKQIATALKYLHNQNLIHGHLDAHNIAKYGNTWKIGKLGTVTKKGLSMRGKFRPCVPPESIFEFNSIVRNSLASNLKKEMSLVRPEPRVKFSDSIEECVTISNHPADERDDLTNVSKEKERRQGSERNDFMNFFGFRSSLDSSSQNDPYFLQRPSTTIESVPKIHFVPERCEATPQWDMWGFGLLMVQLLLGRCMLLPNFEKAEDAILKKLHKHDANALRKICNQLTAVAGRDATDLVMSLLQRDPNLRPKSMEEILAHKYFQVLTIYV